MKRLLPNVQNFISINLGCLIFSLAYSFVFNANHIVPGGLTGLAIVIQYMSKLSFGILNILLNCPAIIVGLFLLGPRSIVLTIYAIFASSFMIDAGCMVLPLLTENRFVAALLGGLIHGLGLGILFNANASIGGTALIGLLINYKLPNVRLGTILLIVDSVIVLISLITFHDIMLALASGLAVFITTVMINQVINQNSVLFQFYLLLKAKLYRKLNILSRHKREDEIQLSVAEPQGEFGDDLSLELK